MTDIQIQCFLTLADNLSYTKTAQLMGISQSTLSAHIQALEKGIQHKLFVRNKRSVVLSAAGEIMYDTLKETSDQIRKALYRIDYMEKSTNSRIAIGIMEGQWSKRFIEKISERFLENALDVQFEIKTFGNAELLEQLDIGNVDMILGYGNVPTVRTDLKSVPIYETPLYLAKRADDKEMLLTDKVAFEARTLILQDQENSPYFEKYYHVFCNAYQFHPEQILRVKNKASIMLNVEMGQGIGFCDDFSMIFGRRQFAFEVVKEPHINYDLIYKPGHMKKVLEEYVNFLEQIYPSRISKNIFNAGF